MAARDFHMGGLVIPPEPQNFGFKFPASGSVPVLFSSMLLSQQPLLQESGLRSCVSDGYVSIFSKYMKANVVFKFFVSPGVNEDIYEAKNSQPKKTRLASQRNKKRSCVKLFKS